MIVDDASMCFFPKEGINLTFILQQQQNLGQRFGTSKMHLSPPLWESVIVLCFVVRYFMSILGLQSS